MTNPNPEPRVFAVIAAAGAGKRMGASLAKQYLPLAGQPLIVHALEALRAWPRLHSLTLVLAPDDPWRAQLASQFPEIQLAVGGAERADSVWAGIEAVQTQATEHDWLLVQDAARPCLTRQDLELLWHELQQDPVGGLLAMPVRDTMKRAEAGRVVTTLCRDALWHALTPQMFRYGLLREALAQARQQGIAITDEASAIELLGRQPKLVWGRFDNLKVTYPQDLPLAELYLDAQHQQGLR